MSYSYPERDKEPEVMRVKIKPCCARCVRGIKSFGLLPCGYPGTCPNPVCQHSKEGAIK